MELVWRSDVSGPLFSASMIPLLPCNSLEINVCMSIVKSRSEA